MHFISMTSYDQMMTHFLDFVKLLGHMIFFSFCLSKHGTSWKINDMKNNILCMIQKGIKQ